MEQQDFINLIKDKAIELQSLYNILPSITISQAILESGWFTSELAQNANNCFGIKWTDGCGYDKYLINTKEIENGQEITVQAYFRKYNCLEDGIKDHAVFLQKDRYKNIIGDSNYSSVANKLYQDGYSTSPEYSSKLIKLIEQYNLSQYDNLTINIKGDDVKMGQIIAIDLGHGVGQDRGAVGLIAEETIINDVGNLVINKLRTLGHEVIELRPSYASSVSDSLYKRYSKSDSNNCDWCISIHANASDGQGHGTEVFTYGAKEIAEARNVLNNIVSLGFSNRGIKDGSNLAMVKRPQSKAMLIEICFCDNQSDFDIYNSVGTEVIANAIVKGLTGQTINSWKQGWNKSNYNGRWFYCTDATNGYYYKEQWEKIEGNWFYFDSEGYLQTGWLNLNDDWFYFNEVSNGTLGRMLTGWIEYKGKKCYLEQQSNGSQGKLYVDCRAVINGVEYTFDKDGYMI